MQYFWALVLILIILEYIYMIGDLCGFRTENVLILIILEYIYIYYAKTLRQLVQGLNPYYTGIHLHGTMKNISGKIRLVLILIILEYIYILHKTHETVDKFVS